MEGIVGFEQLKVECVIGIHPHERITPQPLLIDCRIGYTFPSFQEAECINSVIDYTAVAALCKEEAVLGRYQLIETLAIRITTKILGNFPANWAWIRIQKPLAIPSATAAIVEYTHFELL